MTDTDSTPRRAPVLIKAITTLTVLALAAHILVPEFTLATAFAISGVYFTIGLGLSLVPTLGQIDTSTADA